MAERVLKPALPEKPSDNKPKPNIAPLEYIPPLPNYSLSTVCPACTAPTQRHMCKVRCSRCGFVWDCSEL